MGQFDAQQAAARLATSQLPPQDGRVLHVAISNPTQGSARLLQTMRPRGATQRLRATGVGRTAHPGDQGSIPDWPGMRPETSHALPPIPANHRAERPIEPDKLYARRLGAEGFEARHAPAPLPLADEAPASAVNRALERNLARRQRAQLLRAL